MDSELKGLGVTNPDPRSHGSDPPKMIEIELDLKARIILSSLIGSLPAGTVGQLRVLLDIHKQISLTSREVEDIQFSVSGQQLSWISPSPSYGKSNLALDWQQSRVLKQTLERQLESWEQEGVLVGMADFLVIQRVLDQLDQPTAPGPPVEQKGHPEQPGHL